MIRHEACSRTLHHSWIIVEYLLLLDTYHVDIRSVWGASGNHAATVLLHHVSKIDWDHIARLSSISRCFDGHVNSPYHHLTVV